MNSNSFGLATSATLPYELYRKITENLHSPKDRETLLSLSLVSKAWREESEHALYMEFCDHWADEQDMGILLTRHIGFLCAIIDHPARLGPHVRTYAQLGLATTVGNRDSVRLRGLIVEALPAMVNLQHLHIIPMGGGSMPPNLFKDCTFQLRSLTLLFGLALSGPFLDFLNTQPEIRHLCIAPLVRFPCKADLSQLPEGVCPNLLSTSCIYESIAQVTKGRNMIALETMMDFDIVKRPQLNPYRLHFGRLKYLSLRVHASVRPSNPEGMAGNEIILLKLEVLSIETTLKRTSLWQLPNLRILVFTDAYRTTVEPSFVQTLIESFTCLPNLEYVVVEDMFKKHIGNRFSIAQRHDNGRALELSKEQIFLQHDMVRPWWTAYECI